jgi:hypothetical protein
MVCLTVATVFFTGIAGLDYGKHWDEWYASAILKKQIEKGSYFPQDYIYNGLYFIPGALVLAVREAPLLDDMVRDVISHPTRSFAVGKWSSLAEAQSDALSFIETDTFRLRVRAIFLAWTCTAPIWVYLALLFLFPGRFFEAAAGAAVIGLSWELATHARWIAVDGPQSALIALELYFLAKACAAQSACSVSGAMRGAAITAGLSVGCKLTGIFATIPVILAALFLQRHWLGWRKRIHLLFSVLFVMVLTFAVTTPGAFLDPFHFLNQAARTASQYAPTKHPYSVSGPAEHLGLFALWMISYTTSPYAVVAPILFAIAVIGVVALAKYHRGQTIIWAIFALVLVAKMSQLKLLIVRNYIQLLPLIAVGFGAGVVTITNALREKQILRWIFASTLVLVFLLNAGWLAYTARTIQTTTPETILEDTRDYLRNENYPVLISPKLYRALGDLSHIYECSSDSSAEPDSEWRVVMYYFDHNLWSWESNRIGWIERNFSSLEANYVWYTTWPGRLERSRVVVLPWENAKGMNVRMETFINCRRNTRPH